MSGEDGSDIKSRRRGGRVAVGASRCGFGRRGLSKEQKKLFRSRLLPSSEPSSENTDAGRRHGGEGQEKEEEEEEEEGRATTFVYTYFLYSRKFWNEIRMRGRSSFFLSVSSTRGQRQNMFDQTRVCLCVCTTPPYSPAFPVHHFVSLSCIVGLF
jgi:hypothetical protein